MQKRNSSPSWSTLQKKEPKSIYPACGVLTENADRKGGYASVNRRQAAEGHLAVGISRTGHFTWFAASVCLCCFDVFAMTAGIGKLDGFCVLRISGSLRPTAVSCETVDRCIASLTVGCFRSSAACRFDALRRFGLLCRIAGLLFLFLHAAFLFTALCGASAFACSVFGLIVSFLFM